MVSIGAIKCKATSPKSPLLTSASWATLLAVLAMRRYWPSTGPSIGAYVVKQLIKAILYVCNALSGRSFKT